MTKIIVKDFSCIKSASLDVSQLTLVIGPQASGKSVISKLIYFCSKMLLDYGKFIIADRMSFEAMEKHAASIFSEWFPVSAWGSKRFSIKYSMGPYTMDIARIAKGDRVRVKFGGDYSQFYAEGYSKYIGAIKRLENSDPTSDREGVYAYDVIWKLEREALFGLRRWIGSGYFDNQIFIPAGRSFFTSMGKALFAFENSGLLDPVTLEFGRRFSSLRERYIRRVPAREASNSSLSKMLFSEILGGNLKVEGGKEYIEASDGRLIPFSSLSSGQQELLPLALTIRGMLPVENVRSSPAPMVVSRRMIFIEEPEAHLFPRAQNLLVEILASLVSRRSYNNLFITTHSPYVLAKFNNLIKAGGLMRSKASAANVGLAKIVPEASWLQPKKVAAYAIIDGVVEDILDEDSLIAADYLDDVSGDIADEFSKLLAMEIGA